MKDFEITFTARDADGLIVATGKATVPASDPIEAMEHLTRLCQDDGKERITEPLNLDVTETYFRDTTARDVLVALITSDLDADRKISHDPTSPRLAFALLDSDNYHHAKYAKTAINIANAAVRSRRAS